MAAVAAAAGRCVSSRASDVRVERKPYAGWADAIWMENGAAWVVIVPSVGRVMQFGLVDRPGVFWENPKLVGKLHAGGPMGSRGKVGSFGGDKTWPAPQSAWNWPPPDVFDKVGLEARIEGEQVFLTSPVSERFGITERRIRLAPNAAAMTIDTTYRKVAGEPVEVGSGWDHARRIPIECFSARRRIRSLKAAGRGNGRRPRSWSGWRRASSPCVGNPRAATRSAPAEGDPLVGAKEVLKIVVEAGEVGTPADEGCRVELYTNGGDADYVELETLARLSRMKGG